MTKKKHLIKIFYYKIIFLLFRKKLIEYAKNHGLDWDGDFFYYKTAKYYLNISRNIITKVHKRWNLDNN